MRSDLCDDWYERSHATRSTECARGMAEWASSTAQESSVHGANGGDSIVGANRTVLARAADAFVDVDIARASFHRALADVLSNGCVPTEPVREPHRAVTAETSVRNTWIATRLAACGTASAWVAAALVNINSAIASDAATREARRTGATVCVCWNASICC